MEKKNAGKKKLWIVLCVVAVFLIAQTLTLLGFKGYFKAGNAGKYSVSNAEALQSSPLSGKTIIFLGSSVTYGSQARGESFADFMEKRDGIVAVKEAVSGTTLVDNDEKSYIQRMLTIDPSIQADAFVCQLSTNDASKELPLGEIAEGTDKAAFDTSTVTGAMEYVIAYARETWGCPVIFYTGTKYDSPAYEAMVNRLLELQEKWDIGVIDLWNSEKMNGVSEGDYKLYMADKIHPTRAGYRDWWTPEFEAYLTSCLGE